MRLEGPEGEAAGSQGLHNPRTPDATPADADSGDLSCHSPLRPIPLRGHTPYLCSEHSAPPGSYPDVASPALSLLSSGLGDATLAPFPFICVPSHFEEADTSCPAPGGVTGFHALSP